ncbi:MAG TPA: type II secretion system protein [bacterium]|nr:type II secretion system protein [bacterium]
MCRFSYTNKKGFTLIELLVVIAIIGLLATMAVAALNSARIKARNAKRMSDIEQIYKALSLFFDQYGCLPRTSGSTCGGTGYSDSNAGSWDYSSQGGFMGFLKISGFMADVPVDPINNMTGDGTPAGTYAYRYYCYPGSGLHLGYWRESDHAYINKNSASWANPDFICQ